VLNASQFTTNSVSSRRQNIESSSVAIQLEQRLFQRYYFVFDAEYDHADYTGNSSERVDDIILLRPSVRLDFLRSASLQVGYELWHDSSTIPNRSFKDNRAFAQFAVLF